jgi:hypothetical protein
MNDDYRGEDILELLDGFPSKPLISEIRNLYDRAYAAREERSTNAISLCEMILNILEKPPERTLRSAEKLADSKGRCHLLLATIYLNREIDFEKASEHYLNSKDAFKKMQWSHLESLAYLGLAITLRRLGRLKEASEACEDAYDKSIAESIDPSKIDTKDLQDAIERERARIQELIQRETRPLPPAIQPPSPSRLRRRFRVFDIVAGMDIIEKQPTTKLLPLGLKNYENHPSARYETFDLSNFPAAREANYVLEVGQVSETDSTLRRNDLIFIKQEVHPEKLEDKKVAVLVITRPRSTCATLKFFYEYEDHYFLRGIKPEDMPIIVVSYSTKETMARYYKEYGPFSQKYVYDVAISGEVIAVVPRSDLQ